jgi:signal transduction histidine kinase
MRERVEALGGRLDIESAPGQGTEIRADVPLTLEEEAAS